MTAFTQRARQFLDAGRIAVVGVRHDPHATGNSIYRILRSHGYDVVPVNPTLDEIEGTRCYASVGEVPGEVSTAIVVTRPSITAEVVRDCADAGVRNVWMHDNTFAPTSVSAEAVAFCREQGMNVLDGGCPLMVVETGHKCMRVVLQMVGRLPRGAEAT